VFLAACPPPPAPPAPPIPPVSAGKVRVRVFTEPSPVRMIAPAGRFVFVGTDNDLERWDEGGSVLTLSADHGLSGSHVVAMAPDAERRWVWVLTDGGLGHYDAAAELYAEVPPPPASLDIDFATLAKEQATVAPATDGGAWLGTPRGLYYVSAQGGWTSTPIHDPIRALARDRSGWLWLATPQGLLGRKPTGETVRIGAAQGLEMTEPRLLVELPGARMLVIGADEAGHDRLAFGKAGTFATFRALPEVRWSAATRRGTGAVLTGGDHAYRVSPASDAAVRPLSRDGMRLVPVVEGAPADWVIDPLDVVLPPGAITVGAADDQLLIGTRDLGTARYREGDAQPRDWLRRKEMFQDATTLSVACARERDCWIATGARQAWHWTGESFAAGGPDQVVLAVVRDPNGAIFALHRATTETAMHLSRIDGAIWSDVPKVTIATPGAPEVSFARFAAPGQLWVGLRYRDGREQHPYGVAVVELESGKVTYHRTGDPPTDKKAKSFPVPIGVVDGDVRGDTAWFATNEGVARLSASSGAVKIWTEADGLRSELARAVAIAPNGDVIIATGAGAGVWSSAREAWDFPAALRFEINDLVATRNGQVWMATEHGIAAWDGLKVRRVDTRRGLAENEVLDVAVDQFDRVWARGPGSLTLISQ
jgi:hypothetical protein